MRPGILGVIRPNFLLQRIHAFSKPPYLLLPGNFTFTHGKRPYLEDIRKLIRRHVDHPVVHELDDRVEIVEFDILENDDGVLARIDRKDRL